MLWIHIAAALGLLLFTICFLFLHYGREPKGCSLVPLLFLTALGVRLLSAALSKGFDNDTACFAAWADRMFETGPGNFYSADIFTDYPPGYMYLLYPVGALRSLLGISWYSNLHLVLLKLPAILCDLGCGLLFYREASRKTGNEKALLLCTVYLLNPAVILNSSVWGQTDSVYTLLLLVMCLSLVKSRLFPAYLSFCLGVLVKPQMLLFGPILFLGVLEQVFLDHFTRKRLLRNLAQGLIALFAALVLVLPFGLQNVWRQYIGTLGSYPYAAVNAYNLWGLLGLNWVGQDGAFLGLSYRAYGGMAIAAALLLVLVIGLRRREDREKYPFLAALFMATVFVFSVRMHERYLYPAVVLLLTACIYKPSKKLYLCYCGFSLLLFYNMAHVLFFYDPSNYDRKAPVILMVSAGMLACLAFLYTTIFLPPSLIRPLPPCPSRKADRWSF